MRRSLSDPGAQSELLAERGFQMPLSWKNTKLASRYRQTQRGGALHQPADFRMAPHTQPLHLIRTTLPPQTQSGCYARPALERGNSRMRLLVAAKIALHKAGAKGGNPGSPIPAGGASLGTMYTFVSRGAWFIRAI